MDTTELHDRLGRLAERTAPEPQDAAHLVHTVAARSRARRRQRLGVGAVALAVAAVVASVPAVLSWTSPASPAAPTSAAPDADVLTGATRGSLAGDAAFVEAVRQLPWAVATDPDAPTAQAEPPLESRHVVFAGDVPGGRWALVAAPDTSGAGGSAVLWFAGPALSGPDQLQPVQLSAGLAPGTPVALTDAATGTLVVVAAPGDEVGVSPAPQIQADGSVVRTWQSPGAPDGVLVVALPTVTTAHDEAVRYRVSRGGAVVATALPPGFRSVGYDPPAPSISWLRGPADPGVTAALAGTAADTLTRIGLSPDEVTFAVVWSGDVSTTGDPGPRLSLLTATLPSGATYTEARLTREDGNRVQVGGLCGSEVRAAGAAPADQTFAVRCDDTGTLVVVGPAAAAGARVLDDAGRPVSEYDLDGGTALVPAPPGAARVQTLATDGSVLAEQPVMGSIDLSRG